MTVDVVQQSRALCQALLLGGAMGIVYDLLRILRVRVRIPFLAPVLDLLFWLAATAALFLWSQEAWGGQVRVYGAVFCLVGGGLYFWAISPWLLRLGYLGADLTAALLGILTFPLGLAGVLLKKIRKFAKNVFLSGAKWYKIKSLTGQLDQAARRRRVREGEVDDHAVQTGRIFNQARGAGAADLYGHRCAGPARENPERGSGTGYSGPAGDRPAAGKPKTGRRYRKQRRP
ncbi:hypothetical protein D1646_03105 [Pseudoflavonifractor sp. 60]|nr:hypothetical protein [Pseudoflavonifractor sp. 60]